MAQAPRIQPFDVGGHYQNIGKAAGDLATKPVEGYFRGKEVGAKAQQAGLEAEKTQFELEDYSRKLEEAESSKEALNEVKETTVRLLLGDEGYFALDPNKKEKRVEGDVMVETGGVLKNDVPYEQSLLIVRDINNAKSAKEVKAIMGAVGRFVQTQQEMKKDYPGMKLDTFQAAQLQPTEDAQGNVTAAYGDDYSKRAREIGVPAFLQTEAKTAIQDYIAKNPKNPNEQEALQAVLGGKFGSKIATNKNLRNSIKDMFLSELDRYKAESGRLAAQQKSGREGRKETKDIALQNQNVMKLIDDQIKSAEKTVESKVGAEFKALISTGKYLDPEATKNFTDAQRETLRKKGDEITRMRKVREIPNLATQNGEFISKPQAEAIYDDAIDGTFSSPLTKKYAPALGFQESAPEEEPVQEPAAAPAAPAAPAPQAAAGGYTAEQESLISQYMGQYKGYSREQIIQAMQKEGRL